MQSKVTPHIPILRSIAPLADACDAWISDVWGVLHDGARAHPAASEACVRFRAGGGTIVLVSNAPSTGAEVSAHLDSLGVPRAAYDAIVTSGDVTRALIANWAGKPVHHLGPDRYLGTFAGLDVAFAPIADAAVVVCTGLIEDEHETPDDYRDLMANMRERRQHRHIGPGLQRQMVGGFHMRLADEIDRLAAALEGMGI